MRNKARVVSTVPLGTNRTFQLFAGLLLFQHDAFVHLLHQGQLSDGAELAEQVFVVSFTSNQLALQSSLVVVRDLSVLSSCLDGQQSL
jgi:TfoX/Sxy family transcriptional regulator of competence genes